MGGVSSHLAPFCLPKGFGVNNNQRRMVSLAVNYDEHD